MGLRFFNLFTARFCGRGPFSLSSPPFFFFPRAQAGINFFPFFFPSLLVRESLDLFPSRQRQARKKTALLFSFFVPACTGGDAGVQTPFFFSTKYLGRERSCQSPFLLRQANFPGAGAADNFFFSPLPFFLRLSLSFTSFIKVPS